MAKLAAAAAGAARRAQLVAGRQNEPRAGAELRRDCSFDQICLAEKAPDEGVCGPLIDFARRSDLVDPAVVEDRDAVGHAHRLLLIVRDIEHGHAEALLDLLDLDLHLKAQILVERAQRLVHQHDRRVEDDRARERDALLLAARELMRMAVAEAAEPHQLERPPHPLGDRAVRPAPRAQWKRDVLEHAQMRKYRVVLKHHAKAAFLRRHRCDVLAVEQDCAPVGPDEPGDHHQRRRLA